MAYIGVQPTDTYLSIASQQITGDGGATYTLNYSVSDEESVAVFVNNVRQNVSSYTVSGTSLTLGGTISASDSCWVLFLGRTVGTKTPAVGSVTNAMLQNSSITLNGSAVSLGGSASTGFDSQLFHIRQESSSGTQGGTATSGSWQTRILDTIKTNEIGGSLSSNQFTLPSGTYFISASAPAQDVLANRIKLYNITDSSDVMFGTNSYSDASNNGMRSFLSGRFTIASSKTFEIQHRVNRTNASFGYGIANGYAVEVYTDALIWKVA